MRQEKTLKIRANHIGASDAYQNAVRFLRNLSLVFASAQAREREALFCRLYLAACSHPHGVTRCKLLLAILRLSTRLPSGVGLIRRCQCLSQNLQKRTGMPSHGISA